MAKIIRKSFKVRPIRCRSDCSKPANVSIQLSLNHDELSPFSSRPRPSTHFNECTKQKLPKQRAQASENLTHTQACHQHERPWKTSHSFQLHRLIQGDGNPESRRNTLTVIPMFATQQVLCTASDPRTSILTENVETACLVASGDGQVLIQTGA